MQVSYPTTNADQNLSAVVRCRRGRDSGRRGKAGRGKNDRWWSSLSDACPISLVPLAELDHPPFPLGATASGVSESRCIVPAAHLFDARFLAHWLVSSGDLSDPLNRRPLSRQECVDLDKHVAQYYPELEAVSVTDAFDLQSRGRSQGADRERMPAAQTLRREADLVLQSLFQWGRGHHTACDSNGHRVIFRDGDFQVVDDDDVVTAADLHSHDMLQSSAHAFPPLSAHASPATEQEVWPQPKTLIAEASGNRTKNMGSQHPLVENEAAQNRPRLQLKPRSKDLQDSSANRNETIFGAARPREDNLRKKGSEDLLRTSSPRPLSDSVNLCAYSRTVLMAMVHGEQYLRTRWLPGIERELEQFLADTAARALELGSMKKVCYWAVRELCDHCLVDSETSGRISNEDDVLSVRVQKTSSSRAPLCWLSHAIGRFSSLVGERQELKQPRFHDYAVLLTMQVAPGKATGIEEAMKRFGSPSEVEGPFWLPGSRHALLRFARRIGAQRCCAVSRSGPWMAQWWSGDLEWAQLQLAQSKPSKKKVATTSTAAPKPVPVATYRPVVAASMGGKWSALVSDDSDDDEEEDVDT